MDKDESEQQEAVTVSLPPALLADVDEAVQNGYADRDEFIRAAIRRYLEHLRTTQAAA